MAICAEATTLNNDGNFSLSMNGLSMGCSDGPYLSIQMGDSTPSNYHKIEHNGVTLFLPPNYREILKNGTPTIHHGSIKIILGWMTLTDNYAQRLEIYHNRLLTVYQTVLHQGMVYFLPSLEDLAGFL